jgi:hypothetical protein
MSRSWWIPWTAASSLLLFLISRPMPSASVDEIAGVTGIRYSFQSNILEGGERLRSGCDLGKATSGRASIATIVFIALPAAQGKPETDWAEAAAEGIIRRCPVCACDSIVGHGRRRKQAHDEHHDWIRIRLGLCNICGKTITFLPVFSLPSLTTASSLAVRRCGVTLSMVVHGKQPRRPSKNPIG